MKLARQPINSLSWARFFFGLDLLALGTIFIRACLLTSREYRHGATMELAAVVLMLASLIFVLPRPVAWFAFLTLILYPVSTGPAPEELFLLPFLLASDMGWMLLARSRGHRRRLGLLGIALFWVPPCSSIRAAVGATRLSAPPSGLQRVARWVLLGGSLAHTVVALGGSVHEWLTAPHGTWATTYVFDVAIVALAWVVPFPLLEALFGAPPLKSPLSIVLLALYGVNLLACLLIVRTRGYPLLTAALGVLVLLLPDLHTLRPTDFERLPM